MFYFSWDGVGKIGDFFFYAPFYVLPSIEAEVVSAFMEPPTQLKEWEIRPDSKVPSSFRRQLLDWFEG